MYSIGGGGVIAFQHTYFTSGIDPVSIALAPAGTISMFSIRLLRPML